MKIFTRCLTVFIFVRTGLQILSTSLSAGYPISPLVKSLKASGEDDEVKKKQNNKHKYKCQTTQGNTITFSSRHIVVLRRFPLQYLRLVKKRIRASCTAQVTRMSMDKSTCTRNLNTKRAKQKFSKRFGGKTMISGFYTNGNRKLTHQWE